MNPLVSFLPAFDIVLFREKDQGKNALFKGSKGIGGRGTLGNTGKSG